MGMECKRSEVGLYKIAADKCGENGWSFKVWLMDSRSNFSFASSMSVMKMVSSKSLGFDVEVWRLFSSYLEEKQMSCYIISLALFACMKLTK